MSTHTREFNQLNFDEEVINSKEPVLVDFWSEGCGPCKQIAPTIDELATELDGKVKIGKINAMDNRDISMRYQISSVPTILVFQDGQVKSFMTGMASKKDIKAKLEQVL